MRLIQLLRPAVLWLACAVSAQGEGLNSILPFDAPGTQHRQLVDLSFLNHQPAGQFGRVRAEGDRFVWGTGEEARFWGVNLQAYALFETSDADIKTHARRLARMGVNLARIHHQDSHWVVPNIFGGQARTQEALDDAALERLDRWIAALKTEGIYIWLDLHVGRRLPPDTPLTHVAELQGEPANGDLRGFNFINPDIARDMKRVTAAYLSHVNRYTGLAYKDDPAIAFLLISNENDLVTHFGAWLTAKDRFPKHHALYMARAEAFARAYDVPLRQVWKAWESGTPKRFLADLEARFYAQMITHIRRLGYDGLLATSSFWGGMSLAGLPALSLGDFMDAHSYGRPGELAQDPALEADIFNAIAPAHLVDKPLAISEWNLSPFPAPDRGIAAMRMAAMAAFQGWDAPILYGYAQNGLSVPVVPNNWHAANDPVMMGAFPAAALLYRTGQIQPAAQSYIYRPDPDTLFDKEAIGAVQQHLRAGLAHSKVQVELPKVADLPWLDPAKTAQPGLPAAHLLARNPAQSPGWSQSYANGPGQGAQMQIDSPLAQIVLGDVSQNGVNLSTAQFNIPASDAVFALQSLDRRPIVQSGELFLSLVAAATPDAEGRFEAAPLSGIIEFEAPSGLVVAGSIPELSKMQIKHHHSGQSHRLIFRDVVPPVWVVLARGSTR